MGLLERYEIVRHLGRGASGDVYLARDRLRGGREVALKTLRARVDDLLRAAFEREFATMAQVSVAGVAQVYDFGVLPERPGEPGGPFFTRAYIEGEPLDTAAAKLPLAERVALFREVARVVAALHRAGAVHGDVKPGNVIVDTDGHASLIDFGLSRMGGTERVREALGAAGTPTFMAPELLRGEHASVSGDVYALGVTLFGLAAGEYPFAALGARALSAKLENTLPALPVGLSPLTREVLLVAQRALAPRPIDRFPSVDELVAALDRVFAASRDPGPRAAHASSPPDGRWLGAFVPPRPRGHGPVLAMLEGLVSARVASAESATQSAVWLVQAPAGGGKSLLLRELTWRLSLRSQRVLEVASGRAAVGAEIASLVEQLLVVVDQSHPSVEPARQLLEMLRASRLVESTVVEVLVALFGAVTAEAAVVVMIDDLDRAEAVFGAVLRSVIHAHAGFGVAVIASASQPAAPAVRQLRVDRSFVLPLLSREDVEALASEALGPVDSSVVDALCVHAEGLPGALISALSALSMLTAVTPADVQALPPGEAALSYSQARLARVRPEHKALLHLLASIASLPEALVGAVLSVEPAQAQRALGQLEAQGLISRGGGVMLADGALRKALSSGTGADERRALAVRWLHSPWRTQLPLPEQARIAVAAGDVGEVQALVPEAVRLLRAASADAAALELATALLASATGSIRRAMLAQLAEIEHALGEDERAFEHAGEVARDALASSAERTDGAIVAARALTALGRFDDAVAMLRTVPADTQGACRARVERELAKVHLRRGDYAAVDLAVAAGLASAPQDDPVRIELLCSQGMVASYRSDHAAARRAHEAALGVARAHGERRDQANVLAYLAIGCQRAGDMGSARELLEQSVEIARELGDIGSMATYSMNLGAVLFYLGEPAQAAEHYQSAARLALRAGRRSTEAQARHNLAHIHLYFGLFERARGEIEGVLRDAEDAGHQFIAAQAMALLGDLLARTHQVDAALIRYDDAIARYTKLGQSREITEHHLDAAEALLDRGGPVDTSAAAARLSLARERLEREKIDDLRLRMELLVARARAASGDADGAVHALGPLVASARKARDRDIEWSALSALSAVHETLGARFAAKRDARAAVEVLEEVALRVPREHRDAFWQDPRRRAVRERARESHHDAAGEEDSRESSAGVVTADAARAERERLLEILKRLASEHELDRLLERITESAVDLSGAERGSVLLVDAQGKLSPHVTRLRKPQVDEAHAAFSRSIAEAVLIDGEPIVTVDATADGRLQEYVSVHKLMLRSVAALPIRGHSGTVGVLYLEHRRSRGRFSESAVDLLCAFADQAAIAIENARLLEEVRMQKAELEAKNFELSRAKSDLEDLLLARTRQLDDVQRELSRATSKPSDGARHGMVGRSAVMQRVFDAIERLANTNVSVVIRGESGTGKELVARAIHYGGTRAKAPFVALNCGALPEALLESELFGHVRGAFSGAERDKRGMIAAASAGTLFLDEVSEMPPRMQVDLLRVLQEGKVCRVGSEVEEAVDVRIVCATQRPLCELVAAGKFREDLFYRLSVVEVALPALRERRDDIPLLCEHFLRSFVARDTAPKRHLTRAALAVLMEQPWPGNVRQLEHVLLQASVMCEDTSIDVADLGFGASAHPESVLLADATTVESLASHKLDEKQRILDALQTCGWSRVRAAQTLGMPRRTFYRRLADYGIL